MSNQQNKLIPQAKKQVKVFTSFEDRREDPYHWMSQRDHPDVLAHIKEEDKYFRSIMDSTQSFQDTLFQEMKKRIPGKDSTAPYRSKDHMYWVQYETGKEYPIFCRRKVGENDHQVILDVNVLAQGHEYYDLGSISLSFSHNILAFAVDCVGRRFYDVYFKNLKTGQIEDIKIKDTTGDMSWGNDDQTLFYTKQDVATLRSNQVFRYHLKTSKQELVYQEDDETYHVSLYKSLSKKYIFILSSSVMTTECRFLSADKPHGEFQVFEKRKRGHKYFVSDGEDCFYILTNSNDCKNYRLDKTSLDLHQIKHWTTIWKHDPQVYIEDFEIFKNWVALEVRKQGLSEVLLIHRKTQESFYLDVEGNCRVVDLGVNAQYDTDVIRFDYESMVNPGAVYDYNLLTTSRELIKQKKLAVPFDSEKYESLRQMVTVRDGVGVPLSIFYRKDKFKKGQNPLYQYGYGAYGHSLEPSFYSHIFSLVDRGFVFAIAHIRGGAELGKYWYEQGRLLNKKNTFHDFIDCSEYLIQEGLAHPKKLYAGGGSAGGLLMGSVLNLRPDLYKAIVAHVPFVDVITTMEDKSIPLTTGEYDEWGNPNDKNYYDYIRSYSPYDNVQENEFPHVLVTAGYHDSQVQYWEPMKWVARLRDYQKGTNPILLYMDTKTGHSGATGRFNRLKLLAMEYAFLLNLENISLY